MQIFTLNYFLSVPFWKHNLKFFIWNILLLFFCTKKVPMGTVIALFNLRLVSPMSETGTHCHKVTANLLTK